MSLHDALNGGTVVSYSVTLAKTRHQLRRADEMSLAATVVLCLWQSLCAAERLLAEQ